MAEEPQEETHYTEYSGGEIKERPPQPINGVLIVTYVACGFLTAFIWFWWIFNNPKVESFVAHVKVPGTGDQQVINWLKSQSASPNLTGTALQPVPNQLKTILAANENPAAIKAGEHIFQERCSGCHGKMADGSGPNADNLNPRPRDLVDTQWIEYVSPARLWLSISYGVPGTAMPSWQYVLTEKQRAEVLDYVYHLNSIQQ